MEVEVEREREAECLVLRWDLPYQLVESHLSAILVIGEYVVHLKPRKP